MAVAKNDIKLITLQQAFEIASDPPSDLGAWLYLSDKWPSRNLGSDCFYDDGPSDVDDPIDSDLEYSVKGRVFVPSLDVDSINGCVIWADRLAGKPHANARLEVFDYYCRFDAFPEKLGAPHPPVLTREESMHQLDLAWYNQLGPEDKSKRCKRENCIRGTIDFSAFCRPHHFEMLRKRPCPFSH